MQIRLKEDKLHLRKLALKLASFIGLEEDSLKSPIISSNESSEEFLIEDGDFNINKNKGRIEISISKDDYDRAFNKIIMDIFSYQEEDFDIVKKDDLKEQSMFLDGIYADEFFKRYTRINCNPNDLNFEEFKILCEIVRRKAMDVNSLDISFSSNDFEFEKADFDEILFGEKTKVLYKDFDTFFKLLTDENLERAEFITNRVFRENSYELQFTKAAARSKEIYIDKTYDSNLKAYKDLFKELKIESYKNKEVFKRKDYEFPWERDILLEKLKKYKDIDSIRCAISEPLEVRKELEGELKKSIKGKVQVIDSYKSGFSWIEDYILPDLIGKEVDEIEIYWSYMKGADFSDEAGAVPSYKNQGTGDENKFLDLPIRYLQELYPIDDILAKELSIDRDRIKFINKDMEDSYEIIAKSKGRVVLRDTYKVILSERPYLDDFKRMGLVHPHTGYFEITIGDKKTIETFKTDLENVWDTYQNILSEIGKNIENKNLKEDSQPFFAELYMDISLSETDKNLNIRQDRISSIDHFHEDLYFVGLDYFKTLGQKMNAGNFDSPGLILPFIHNRKGNVKFEVELRNFLDTKPFVIKDSKKEYLDMNISYKLLGYRYENGPKLIIECSLNGEELEIYSKILNRGLSKFSDLKIKALIINGKEYEVCEKYKLHKKAPAFDEKVLNHEDICALNDSLRSNRDLKINYIAKSFMGRDIESIEFNVDDDFTPTFKRTMKKPTMYINERHHANEVSSSNSCYELTEKLLEEKELLKKVNVVLIPMENPDGSYIHSLLIKEHPNWIFHIARFNALGKEFAHEYFKEDSIHTEAEAMVEIFYRHLPDIYCDNHGVPHHEWAQPFSGYTAPAYKGFWLPRSLIYGYFWYPKEEEYSDNYKLCEELQDVIADSINKDDLMHKMNLDMQDRFEKYAHALLPKMFPTGYYKDIIFYWIGFDTNRDHRYLSIRYPEITKVGFTSEVIDETADGEFLKLCSKAHTAHNLDTIKFISQKEILFDRKINTKCGGRIYRNRRRTKW